MAESHYRKDYQRAYYLANKERIDANRLKWQRKNRDKAKAYRARVADRLREYNKAPDRLAKAAARTKIWTAANPERHSENRKRWKLQNPERVRELAKAWRENNREMYLLGRIEVTDRRRARKLANGWEKVDLSALLTLHGMHCYLCDEPIESAADLSFDHVVPLFRGGAHKAENLRPAHRRCNEAKGVKLVAEL